MKIVPGPSCQFTAIWMSTCQKQPGTQYTSIFLTATTIVFGSRRSNPSYYTTSSNSSSVFCWCRQDKMDDAWQFADKKGGPGDNLFVSLLCHLERRGGQWHVRRHDVYHSPASTASVQHRLIGNGGNGGAGGPPPGAAVV